MHPEQIWEQHHHHLWNRPLPHTQDEAVQQGGMDQHWTTGGAQIHCIDYQGQIMNGQDFHGHRDQLVLQKGRAEHVVQVHFNSHHLQVGVRMWKLVREMLLIQGHQVTQVDETEEFCCVGRSMCR